MPTTTAHLNLSLDFDQVLHLVRQLPKKQQQQLADLIGKEEAVPAKKRTDKEQSFLTELDEAVAFVNNYPKEKTATTTFQQMLDALLWDARTRLTYQ